MTSPVGTLRHRLALERSVRTGDGGGGVTESWVLEADVWGEVRPLAGQEALEADRISGRVSHDIRIRYRAGVVPAMRFRLDTRAFHIVAVLDEDERRRWLTCRCEARDL